MGSEFYILLLVFTAAAVIAIVRPRRNGPVREFTLRGHLIEGGHDPFPRVEVWVDPSGETVVRRSGWEGMTPAKVILEVQIKGFDISLTEKTAFGGAEEVDCAEFHLELLARNERYHIRYESVALGRTLAFYFTVKEGMRIVRELC